MDIVSESLINTRTRAHNFNLPEPRFVGRQKELADLLSAVDVAKGGTCHAQAIYGSSGVGKSRLLDEFEIKARLQKGAVVFRGSATPESRYRPFHIFAGVVCEILSQVSQSEKFESRLREELADVADTLTVAIPDLIPLFGTSESQPDLEQFGETRVLDALIRLINSLGTSLNPAVVILDNSQWADQLSQKVIERWQRQAQGKQSGHLMTIAAYRTEESSVPDDDSGNVMLIEPLSAVDSMSFIQSMAGRYLPQRALESILKFSEGNPFMIGATLRGLVESHALVATSKGWEMSNPALYLTQFSHKSADILVDRLKLLSSESLQLLKLCAVAGKQFSESIFGCDPNINLTLLESLVSDATQRHFIWYDKVSKRYSFTHDRIREVLLKLISPEEEARLHLMIATHYEANARSELFKIATHFSAAGEHGRAFPYAIEAAKQARARFAFDIAIRFYKMALDASMTMTQAEHCDILRCLAEVCVYSARYREASVYGRRALSLAVTDIEIAKAECMMSRLALNEGDLGQAEARALRSLSKIGRSLAPEGDIRIFSMFWEASVYLFFCALPFLLVRKKGSIDPELLALEWKNVRMIHYIMWYGKGISWGLRFHLKFLNRYRKYPPSHQLAELYAFQGIGYSAFPFFGLAQRYIEHAHGMFRVLGNRWGQGLTLSYLASANYAVGKNQTAIERALQAIPHLTKTGDFWEGMTAEHIAACAHYRLGDLATAVKMSEDTYHEAKNLGEYKTMCNAVCLHARATFGATSRAVVESCREQFPEDRNTVAHILLAKAICFLRDKQFKEAIATFIGAKNILEHPFVIRNEYVTPVYIWLVTAYRMQAESDAKTRNQAIANGLHASRQAVKLSKAFPNNAPHALRDLGILLFLKGKRKKALKFFEQSLVVADGLSAKHEWALTMKAYGKYGQAAGWPNSDQTYRTGLELCQKIEGAITSNL